MNASWLTCDLELNARAFVCGVRVLKKIVVAPREPTWIPGEATNNAGSPQPTNQPYAMITNNTLTTIALNGTVDVTTEVYIVLPGITIKKMLKN